MRPFGGLIDTGLLLFRNNMKGFYTNIARDTLENENFRKVLFTGPHSQLVVMCLLPNEEIGMEVHPDNDQFIRIESGSGKAVIGDEEFTLNDDDAVVIPAGSNHNIINASNTHPLKLYTIYSPAHHPERTVHKTKADVII